MSGRKRIYVDEAAWRRLQSDAGKLAQVNRDLPRLIQQVREHTDRTVERSLAEIGTRHEQFEQALDQLSEQTRAAEQQTEQRLRDTSRRLMTEIGRQSSALREHTTAALAEQREQWERAIDAERAERARRFDELHRQVSALQDGHARAAQLTATYLADAAVLRDQVLGYPVERYAPGRLAQLDDRLASLQADLARDGVAPFLLGNARDLLAELSALRAEVALAHTEWQAYRCAAEAELIRLQGVQAGNRTLDSGEAFGLESPTRLDVDHWSRGALERLAGEIDALLTQVRAEEPMTTAELRELLDTTAPELDQRLDSVVAQAVTAVRASQLRANLAELIADALDRDHHYQVADGDFGYAGADQRAAYLAKSTHHVSGSEIVIEIEPAPEDDDAPSVHLHNFDHNASEEERQARTASIHTTVRQHTGIELRTTETPGGPDPAHQDVRQRVRSQEKRRPEPGRG